MHPLSRRALAFLPLGLGSPAVATPAAAQPGAPQLLVIRFGYTVAHGIFRQRMDEAAPLLARVPGLLWKVWAIDEASARASGVYLFADAAAATRYLDDVFAPHMGASPMLRDIAIERFGVMDQATRTTRGRLG